MDHTTNLRLPFIMASQAQKHVTHNEALATLDALVQLAVIDRDLAAPPVSPAEGDRYIVAASATGDWDGEDRNIALFQDGAWQFVAPNAGFVGWVVDEAVLVYSTGSAWATLTSAITALQNLSQLGIGTTADDTNPFSAKLNKALWSARTAAEGGDGDLRYSLNKETAADVVSFLMQTGFSSRAEIGLVGDDNLTFKVSANGSTWLTPLVIDRTSGAATFNASAIGTAPAALSGTNMFLHNADNVARLTIDSLLNSTTTFSNLVFRKAGHSSGTPTGLANDSRIGGITFFGHDGTAYTGTARATIFCLTTEAWASGANGTRISFATTANGSTSQSDRLGIENDGALSMGGSTNTVIDGSRHFRLRSYTVGALPSASPAGQMIYCSDLGGGGGQLVSNGAAWRRESRSGQQTVTTNAAITLTTLNSAEEQKHTGTLTADRAVTLSATNAYAGARFRITRTGGGAFNLNVGTGPLKALATGTWAEFMHDGTDWYLASCGTL